MQEFVTLWVCLTLLQRQNARVNLAQADIKFWNSKNFTIGRENNSAGNGGGDGWGDDDGDGCGDDGDGCGDDGGGGDCSDGDDSGDGGGDDGGAGGGGDGGGSGVGKGLVGLVVL